MFRETAPHFYGAPSYPPSWWKRQPKSFFPKWQASWFHPQPRDGYDPLFDRYAYQGVFANDDVLPCQLDAGTPQLLGEFLYPGQRLAWGMLEQARNDIEHNVRHAGSKRRRRVFEEAWAWIFDEDQKYFFSFLNCCEHTDTDAEEVRQKLRHYYEMRARLPLLAPPPRDRVLRAADFPSVRIRHDAIPELPRITITRPLQRPEPLPPYRPPVIDRPRPIPPPRIVPPVTAPPRVFESQPVTPPGQSITVCFLDGPLGGTQEQWTLVLQDDVETQLGTLFFPYRLVAQRPGLVFDLKERRFYAE